MYHLEVLGEITIPIPDFPKSAANIFGMRRRHSVLSGKCLSLLVPLYSKKESELSKSQPMNNLHTDRQNFATILRSWSFIKIASRPSVSESLPVRIPACFDSFVVIRRGNGVLRSAHIVRGNPVVCPELYHYGQVQYPNLHQIVPAASRCSACKYIGPR